MNWFGDATAIRACASSCLNNGVLTNLLGTKIVPAGPPNEVNSAPAPFAFNLSGLIEYFTF